MDECVVKITDSGAVARMSRGEVVELPAFLNGEPFVARLRSASLIGLAAAGVIPNPLISVAEGLFSGRISEVGRGSGHFKETAEMFHIVAKNALAEPTLDELADKGVMLTDMQYLAIFNYTQMGAKALAGFRGKQGGDTGAGDGGPLPHEAQ